MRRWIGLVAHCISIPIWCQSAHVIQGVIRHYRTPTPIQGCLVRCTDKLGRTYEVMSDKFGAFRFNFVTRGPVHIEATGRQFDSESREILPKKHSAASVMLSEPFNWSEREVIIIFDLPYESTGDHYLEDRVRVRFAPLLSSHYLLYRDRHGQMQFE